VYKVAVITDSETATGFRLAGVEVSEAATPQETLDLIRQYTTAGYGLLAVNEDLLVGTEDTLARLLRGREAYIQRLVKEHIGFSVKLK
jgi:V/A-type H+-transporting ATPase subunit F